MSITTNHLAPKVAPLIESEKADTVLSPIFLNEWAYTSFSQISSRSIIDADLSIRLWGGLGAGLSLVGLFEVGKNLWGDG